MALEDVRKMIDSIDPQIRDLLMKRLDCSNAVVQAKIESGDMNIYRADREQAILERLGRDVAEDRRAGYLAVVRKIMETSRMYQYGLLYDRMNGENDAIFNGVDIHPGGKTVRIRLTRENRPNAMSSILSMIGDYGYNSILMELMEENESGNTVTFEILMAGDLSDEHTKKLMFQLSRETRDFKIVSIGY